MLNLKNFNSMTDEKFEVLDNLLTELEGQSVNINFNTNVFAPSFDHKHFYGWIDDKFVYIGDINYCPCIAKSNIIDMVYNRIDNNITLDLALADGCLVNVYN